ncbi:MAG: PEGA domain-containing protein [Candidatus Nitrospinota bacterium M3_3B_026]
MRVFELAVAVFFVAALAAPPAFANGVPESATPADGAMAGSAEAKEMKKTESAGPTPPSAEADQEITPPVSGAGAEAVAPAVSGEGTTERRIGVVTTSPMPPTIRKVSVLIESSPSNCDIEIDGVYVGSTPVQLSLKEGVHHVKISREGYLPWAKAVKAYHGLYVNPALVSESARSADIKESASAR